MKKSWNKIKETKKYWSFPELKRLMKLKENSRWMN